MDMTKIRNKIAKWCRKLRDRGARDSFVATEMFRQGLTLFRDEDGDRVEAVVLRLTDNNGVSIEYPMPGHYITIRSFAPAGAASSDMAALTTAFGEMGTAPGRYLVTIDEEGEGFTVEANAPDHTDLISQTARLLHGYAEHHMAKSPPDLDKARRNVRQAARLFDAIDEYYSPPPIPEQSPQEAAREAQERDRLPGTGERPNRTSDAPLDREEMLAWFDLKLDGCAKHGLREASDILQAMRNEVAQHLEAAPIDYENALAAFYKEVYERNVKAGWWTDLATGKPKKRSVGELFVLFVTELAEAYDAYLTREPDDKLPHLPGLTVELADLQIRFADFAGALAAGNIVEDTSTRNPGAIMLADIVEIARQYEAIRKTDAAKGDDEQGDYLPVSNVAGAVIEKLAFNAKREDHKIENRLKDDGKRT